MLRKKGWGLRTLVFCASICALRRLRALCLLSCSLQLFLFASKAARSWNRPHC